MRKAILGSLVAGLGALVTALADDGVTRLEWAVIAFTVAGTVATVYGVKNDDPKL
jgi:hypothetical protein